MNDMYDADYEDCVDPSYEDTSGEPYWGDPRRCPRHPHVMTSSPDGAFDCDCYLCEAEDDRAYQQMLWDEKPSCEKARDINADMDPMWARLATCQDCAPAALVDDDTIPF